ncbi:DUF7129 domain-containing putative zinc-binding protein [Haladaptatus litoreus]
MLKNFIRRYRSSEVEDQLYECILCGETASAATTYIMCPECGGKLERIDLAS